MCRKLHQKMYTQWGKYCVNKDSPICTTGICCANLLSFHILDPFDSLSLRINHQRPPKGHINRSVKLLLLYFCLSMSVYVCLYLSVWIKSITSAFWWFGENLSVLHVQVTPQRTELVARKYRLNFMKLPLNQYLHKMNLAQILSSNISSSPWE